MKNIILAKIWGALNPVAVTQLSVIAFLDIYATAECRFILKRVCDTIKTHIYSFLFCFINVIQYRFSLELFLSLNLRRKRDCAELSKGV